MLFKGDNFLKKCLFCTKEVKSKTDEHIIPESLGNKTLIISGVVCSNCNNGVLSDLDDYFCHNNIFAENKMLYNHKTKKGKFPKLTTINGTIEKTNDNEVKLTSYLKEKKDFYIKTTNESWEFCFDFTKRGINPHKISRFLTKVGIESLFHFNGDLAYSQDFNKAREYTFQNQKNNFIPFSWVKTQNPRMGIFMSEAVRNDSDKYYISILRLYNCDYFIQLNDPYNPYALEVLNTKFNLNYVKNNKQILPETIKNSITFKSDTNENHST